jgi:hypothetical protein
METPEQILIEYLEQAAQHHLALEAYHEAFFSKGYEVAEQIYTQRTARLNEAWIRLPHFVQQALERDAAADPAPSCSWEELRPYVRAAEQLAEQNKLAARLIRNATSWWPDRWPEAFHRDKEGGMLRRAQEVEVPEVPDG